MVVLTIITLLLTVAMPIYDRQVLKARADEAKLTIQMITFAQERYFQENGEYYPDDTSTIVNENNIHTNLRIDLKKSNNFIYSITGGNGSSYSIKAILKGDSTTWPNCNRTQTDTNRCKQFETPIVATWTSKYKQGLDNHYLSFNFPILISNDFTENGISYAHLYDEGED